MDINNESHNSELPSVTEGQTPQPLQSITYMEQTTPPAKKKWYKSKVFLILLLLILLSGGGASAYVLVIKKDDSNSTTQTNTHNNETPTETEEEAFIYEADGVPGLVFSVPEEWTIINPTSTFTEEVNESFDLYSPDAEADQMATYSGINAGYSIAVGWRDRDLLAEKGKVDPIDNYTSTVGSPKIDEDGNESYQGKIDESQYKTFKNDNGVEMVAYPWNYEGCFISVTTLGKKSVFSFSITQGAEGCPKLDILTKNEDIKNFIDSVKLSEENTKIETKVFASTFSAFTDSGERRSETYSVRSGNISFNFKPSRDEGDTLISNHGPIPKMKDGLFDKLQFGSSLESMIAYYKECESCGFSDEKYDNSVSYVADKPDTADYKEVSPGIFGEVKDVEALQKDARAKKYTYVRPLGDGYIVVEIINETDRDAYKFPAVDADFAVKTMKSFKTL